MSDKIGSQGLIDDLISFCRDYYRDEIGELANAYPRDQRSLEIEWLDLYRSMPDFADDLLQNPHGGATDRDPMYELHEALYNVDIPIDISLQSDTYADAHVRVKLPEDKRLGIDELRKHHRQTYTAIQGQIERVSQQTEYMNVGAFRCTSCDGIMRIPQPRDQITEPTGCSDAGCSGNGFELMPEHSDTVDLRVLKIKQPPESASGNGKSISVYLEDDLAFTDGDRTLAGMAGERVSVHGVLQRDMSNTRGRNTKPMFGTYMDAHALEFENTVGQDIDMAEYTDSIQEHADASDTLERLIESFAPNVAGGDRIYHIKRAALLYLFGGYRKTNADGSTYRGDIHFMMVGDPATGKSSILDYIERVSPRIERLSGTDSTGVGLTASAEQTEGGQWVLKPGVLPRASGGHAIVDELDKMGEGADNLHEALESQRIHTAKAGMKATLKTETGLIAAANPESGRFGDYDDIISEIDVDPALFSRFDIIHTLRDKPDGEKDRAIAEATLDGWQSSGEDTGELDVPVQPDTLRAWIAHAKSLEPSLSDAAKEIFIEFYTDERTKDWGGDNIPITARALPAGARLAEAHARMNLRKEVIPEDARVATDVIRAMMGDIYMDDQGRPDVDAITDATPTSQKERRESVKDIVSRADGDVSMQSIRARADERGIDPDKAEEDVEFLCMREGTLYEPSTDHYNTT